MEQFTAFNAPRSAEAIEAVDRYRQRATDCEGEALKEILLRNTREEMELAAMAREWTRRNSTDFERYLQELLLQQGDIADHQQCPNGERL